jgi:hypothetical protein
MAITQAIFDLCSMPEYIEPLRSEAQVALAQTNGEWQFSTTKKLARLDSFLKKSQRLNQSTFRKFAARPFRYLITRELILLNPIQSASIAR